MMVHLLNQHRRIFVAAETDILWYMFSKHSYFAHHDDDVEALHLPGLTRARRQENKHMFIHDSLLTGDSRDNFFGDVLFIKDKGMKGHQPAYPEKQNDQLVWLGDKKPAQSSDPLMRPWIEFMFPDAKYLHMVRHPLDCISSMAGLDWGDGNVEFLTAYYLRLERQANNIEDKLLLRYEDVRSDPIKEMERVCDYLELNVAETEERYDAAGHFVLKQGVIVSDYLSEREKVSVPMTDELEEICELYGYL